MAFGLNFVLVRKIALFVFIVLLSACGGSDQTPPGSTVEIMPGSVVWRIGQTDPDENCEFDPNSYQDNLVSIRVLDPQGRPVGEAPLVVSMALSGNTYSFSDWVELYEDKDGDLIPDADELVSGEGDPLLFTSTAEFTGEKYLIVRMNLSCTYGSNMTVTSAGALAKADFDVIEEQ